MPTEPSLKWPRAIFGYHLNPRAAQWEHGIIVSFLALFVCTSLVFTWRRLCGALSHPLPAVLLIPAGLLMAVMALGIRTLWRAIIKEDSSNAELLFDFLLAGSLLIFAAALSLPGANAWALGLFWLLLAAEEVWAWRHQTARLINRLRSKRASFRPVRIDPAQSALPHVESARSTPGAVAEISTMPDWPAKHVTQQLIRSTAADGADVLSGWLRLGFAAGQRMGNLHVAFCPPFVHTPEFTVLQLDGPEARIKIAQLLPYGARLDLKLISFTEEPTSILLQFTARATSDPPAD